MNTIERRFWHDGSALAAAMATTALVILITGCAAMATWRARGGDDALLGGDDALLASLVVRLLFALLAATLAVNVQASRKTKPAGAVYATALGGLIVFLAYDGAEALAWLTLYPALATLALGPFTGSALAIIVGTAGIALTRDSGTLAPGAMPAAALAYAALVALAYNAERRAGASRSAGLSDDAITAGTVTARATIAGANQSSGDEPVPLSLDEAQGEITVLYRQEALDTLTRVPNPEAILSYIILEGMAGGRDSPPGRQRGDYRVVSLGIDDLLAKAESVIEAREAKRLMEFNKIQAQIDASLSREGEPEPRADDAYAFDRLSFSFNLSEREVAVARCILKGMTNKEISCELFISVETVKTHVKNLFKKCEIGSRIEFIKLFSRAQPVPANEDDGA